jgi:hypothetical protein
VNCRVLTVSEARRWEWPKDSGQFNEDYELTLEGQEKPAILTQKPTTAPPKVGDVLDLNLEPHPRFDGKLKAKRVHQGGAGGGGFKPRDPKETAAIVRQHSQHMAVLYLQAKIAAGAATKFPSLDELKVMVDWFDADVASIKAADGQRTVNGLPVRGEPVPTSTPEATTPTADYPAPASLDGTPFAA